MRHLSIATCVVIVTFAAPLFVCADEGSETLQTFEGGDFSAGAYISLGFFYGAGARPDGLGVPISTARSRIASVTGNPAGLAFLRTGGVLIDAAPPIAVPIGNYIDLEEQAAEMIDEMLEDMASPTLDPVYPTVEAEVGQAFNLDSGAVAWRLGPIVAGAAIEQPTKIAINLSETGLEAFAESVTGEPGSEIEIQLRALADATADVAFEIRRVTFAAGTTIAPTLGAGFSFSQYHGSGSLSASLRGDGIVSYAGQEYSFNDPSDPWDNELGYTARGQYDGDAFGWTAGVSWQPMGWMTLDAAYVNAPTLTLSGELTSVQNMPTYLDDGELALDEVSPTEPTLTERTEETHSDDLALELPSYMGAAASFKTGFLTTTLEYRRYLSSISFEYEGDVAGVELSDGAGAEFDFGVLRLGGGVMRGTLMNNSDDEEPEEIMIPLANLGLGFGIGEHLRFDAAMLMPLEVLRVSATYEF